MPAEWPALAASSNRKPLEFGVPARLGRAAEQGGAALGFAVVGGLRIRRNPPGEGWGCNCAFRSGRAAAAACRWSHGAVLIFNS